MIDLIIQIVEPIGKFLLGAYRRLTTETEYVHPLDEPVSANITYYSTEPDAGQHH